MFTFVSNFSARFSFGFWFMDCEILGSRIDLRTENRNSYG